MYAKKQATYSMRLKEQYQLLETPVLGHVFTQSTPLGNMTSALATQEERHGLMTGAVISYNYNYTYTPPRCTYAIESSPIGLASCEDGTCMLGGLVVSSAPHSPDMQAYPGACKPIEILAGGVVRHSCLVGVRNHP